MSDKMWDDNLRETVNPVMVITKCGKLKKKFCGSRDTYKIITGKF